MLEGMTRRRLFVVGCAALVMSLGSPSGANADLASLKAACKDSEGVRFCDDGVPDAGGRTPNVGGVKAIEVPAAYAGHQGLPLADPAAAALVPGNSAGNVAIDANLTLPGGAAPPGGRPLVVFMHGCCGGNKTDWESSRIDNLSEQWHYNNRWFALRGYAVLTYTARGFVTTTPTGDKGSTGETQIDHRAYEINDLQHLAGQLADDAELGIDPQRVVVVGGSYGGGFGWMALTDPRWRSPGGKEMRLAAVTTKYGWTDLAYSLAPTGSHLPDVLPPFDGSASTAPPGMLKRSFTAALFQSGAAGTPNANGSRHATFAPAITQTLVCLNAADPSQLPPGCEAAAATIEAFVRERSAYYQNEFFAALAADPSLATPVYVGGTFSDQLFTAIESLRMIKRLRSAHPGYPVQQYFGDYQHGTQNKAKEWADVCGEDRHVCTAQDGEQSVVSTGVNTRVNRFLDHFARPEANPGAPAPAFDATASLYVCRTNAGPGRPLDEPGERFTAPDFAALAPHELAVAFDATQTTTSLVAGNDHALQADPVANAASNGGSCPNTTTPPAPGVAAWQTEPLPQTTTMIGLSRLTYRYAATTVDPASLQLNTRLYDVAPDGRATLVDRGVRRLTDATGEVTYALHGQAWRFEAGHAIRIEATQDDDPYVRRSTTPSSLIISRAELRMPVRERGATAVPRGEAPRGDIGGGDVDGAGACRPSMMDRATARPARRGLRFGFARTGGPVTVSVFQQSRGRRVLRHRLVARFTRRGPFTWNGRANRVRRRVTNGVYTVRFTRGRDVGRLAVERRRGRFRGRGDYAYAPGCGTVRVLRVTRPVLGGRRGLGVRITFRLGRRGDATVLVKRGRRTLRTWRRSRVAAGPRVQLRLSPRGVPRGPIRVVLRVRAAGTTTTRSVAARRL